MRTDAARELRGPVDAEGESWRLEDLLTGTQVPRQELLPDLMAGTGAAVGRADKERTREEEEGVKLGNVSNFRP